MSSDNHLTSATWRKSSYSAGEKDCVEVRAPFSGLDRMGIRDSKNPAQPLTVPAAAFAALIRSLH